MGWGAHRHDRAAICRGVEVTLLRPVDPLLLVLAVRVLSLAGCRQEGCEGLMQQLRRCGNDWGAQCDRGELLLVVDRIETHNFLHDAG